MQSAKRILEELNKVNQEIDSISIDPEDFIDSYCSNEKNKIDLKRETLISTINDISDEMINKIKQMETDSKSNLKHKQNYIDSSKFNFKKGSKNYDA